MRQINVKIGVQRRKSRDGVVVSSSARQAGGGPWFDSRSRRDRFFNANFCFFILFPALCFTLFLIYIYEGESISNQPNLFPVEIHLLFFDVIAL